MIIYIYVCVYIYIYACVLLHKDDTSIFRTSCKIIASKPKKTKQGANGRSDKTVKCCAPQCSASTHILVLGMLPR